MKGLAALGAAALIAAAGVLWFMSRPTLLTSQVEPLKPNATLPEFKRVTTVLDR